MSKTEDMLIGTGQIHGSGRYTLLDYGIWVGEVTLSLQRAKDGNQPD